MRLKDLNGVQCARDGAVVRVAHELDVAANSPAPHGKVLDRDVVPGVKVSRWQNFIFLGPIRKDLETSHLDPVSFITDTL